MTPKKLSHHTLAAFIAEKLREHAKRFNPALESAPVAVLWTDEKEDWKSVIPVLKNTMPELFELGVHKPGARMGPGIWLRLVADRKAGSLAPDQVPIIYLPGVSNGALRTDLRTVKDNRQLAPIAELQYRGVFWRQENSKDWTLRAFLESKRGGLGLSVKGNQDTLKALKIAFGKLLSRSLAIFDGRTIDEAFLDEIINPNPEDDVLRWLEQPQVVQAEKANGWESFLATARSRYGVELNKGALEVAATVLAAKEPDSAYTLWEKYATRPGEYEGLYELFKQVPKKDLFGGPDRYPLENEVAERALAQDLLSAATLDPLSAAKRVLELEALHTVRGQSLWAEIGKAPMAQALAHLAVIARANLENVTGGSVIEQASAWASNGWQVDASALMAMAIGLRHEQSKPINAMLAALYRRWLERTAEALQARVRADGYPSRFEDPVEEGTVLLFVDGLRLDLARLLEKSLMQAGLKVVFQHCFTSIPSVTSSGKVWCAPAYSAASGAAGSMGFEPNLRVAKSAGPYTADRLRKALEEGGLEIVDAESPSIAVHKGWAEALEDIDSDGHNKGLRLAEEAPRHIERLVKTIQRLFNAGWQQVRVVTDHGWLLLPGGLPKVELPAKLTETKWARCAVLKDAAETPEGLVMSWSYSNEVRIALAPGISAFKAGQEYDHGGLTLQESVVPRLIVTSAETTASRPRIKGISWNTRKTICTVDAENAHGLTVGIERLGNSVAETVEIGASGKGKLIFEEVDDLLGEAVSVLLLRDGQKVAELQINFGEEWHAT